MAIVSLARLRGGAAVGLIVLLSHCALGGRAGVRAGARIHCPNGSSRVAANCASATALRGQVFQTNLGIPKIGLGLSAAYEDRAVQQVSAATQQLALELDSRCEQYNACAIDGAAWLESENRLRRHVELVSGLTASSAPSQADAVWTNALPELAKVRLQVQLQVQSAPLNGTFVAHASGEPLPSGQRVRFVLRSSVVAYVYVLLLSSQGRAEQLFPRAGIEQQNPIDAQREVAIPGAAFGAFQLDEHPGVEHVQIVASTHPLADIDTRLSALGQARDGGASSVLRSIGGLLCAPAGRAANEATLDVSSARCGSKRDRGLVLVTAAPSASSGAYAPGQAVSLRAEPGDDVVLLQHEIKHVAK